MCCYEESKLVSEASQAGGGGLLFDGWSNKNDALVYLKELAAGMAAVLLKDRLKREVVEQAIDCLQKLLGVKLSLKNADSANHDDLIEQKKPVRALSDMGSSASPTINSPDVSFLKF